MRVWAGDNTTHTNLRGTLQEAVGDKAVCMAHAIEGAGDSQDTVVHTRYNLADASTDTSLVAQVCYVLAGLANDDTGFLGRDNGAQGQLGLAVLLVVLRALNDAAVGRVETAEPIRDVVDAGVERRGRDVVGRHGVR